MAEIDIVCDYSHSPLKVWRAVTDPALIPYWTSTGKGARAVGFEPVVGNRFQFVAKPMRALQRNVVFAAAAFPSRVSQPMMNRYAPGMEYGPHVDNSLMGGNEPLRTDMSGTLFLSDPTGYDGGELIVESPGGRQSVKLPPGDLFLYASTRVHYVAPVTRGARLGVVFWIQSLVRDSEQRTLLFEVSQALSVLQQERGQTPDIMQLTACYHRLVQMWAQP